MIKLITIIGARPQIIKSAAISRVIREKFNDRIEEVVIHTGQHYDEKLSQVFFDELNINPEKYNLGVGSGSHAEQTAKMILEIEKVILLEKPNAILLYGDTNSTLAACIVGIKLHIPIIHVEAGVRSYNKHFPEEVNRLICDHTSSMLFVCSNAGIDSLEKEGFKIGQLPKEVNANSPVVYRCGDIMYDNMLYFCHVVKTKNIFAETVSHYKIPTENFVLATMHRPSNVDETDSLSNILKALNHIADTYHKSIVLPLHPRTQQKIKEFSELNHLLCNKKIHIIPPASYLEMIALEDAAELIITDSGGVQKEACFLKKPAIILLEETPWIELIENKYGILTGSDYQKIVDAYTYFMKAKDTIDFKPLYGDGKAAEFICGEIVRLLK